MNGQNGGIGAYSVPNNVPQQQGLFNPQTLGLLMSAIGNYKQQNGMGQQYQMPQMGGQNQGMQSQPGYQLGQPLVGGQNGQPVYAQPQNPNQPSDPNQMPSPLLAALMRQPQPGVN